MRSIFFEQKSRCVQKDTLRGSSVMNVKRPPKHRIFQGIDFRVAARHFSGTLDVALGISVEYVLELHGRDIVHRVEADDCGAGRPPLRRPLP
jgi:hypothetical protein